MRRASDISRLFIVAALVAMIAGWPGPVSWIERAVAPVIRDVADEDINRNPFLACWRWSFLRLRAAEQININLDIHVPPRRVKIDGEDVALPRRRIDAIPLIWGADGLRYFRVDQSSKPSPDVQSRVVCIDLARARVEPSESIIVTFSATYVAWPGLWTTRYDMRDVVIPAARHP